MQQSDPWIWFVFYLALGACLGTVMYRSDFCMAAILRDVFLFKDRERLRHLLLAIVLTFILFSLTINLLKSTPVNFPGFSQASLLGILGGFVFGVGMVLAGGCVISTLYKVAGGNLTYLLVFGGIVVGSLIYAEMFPWLLAAETQLSLDMPSSLMMIWPQGTLTATWILAILFPLVLIQGFRKGQWHVNAAVEGYLQPWLAAVLLALINVSAFLFSGWPVGISTAYAKIGAFFENLIASDHVATLAYFNRTTLEAMIGNTIYRGSAGPTWDLFSMTEGALMMGVLLGAFVNALLLKEFRIYGFPPARQGCFAFVGGILLALGARMANGCNIKHLLGGLPLLSLQSMLFIAGLLAGIWFGTKLLPRIILR